MRRTFAALLLALGLLGTATAGVTAVSVSTDEIFWN